MSENKKNATKILANVKDLLPLKPKIGISSYELDDAIHNGEDFKDVIKRHSKKT